MAKTEKKSTTQLESYLTALSNEIISKIEKGKNIIPIVGHNATGKTQLLDKINENLGKKSNWNVLCIKSETIFNEEIKKSSKKDDEKYSANIKKFINKLFGLIQIPFSEEIEEKIQKANDFIKKFYDEIEKNSKNNKYFKNEIKNIIKSKYEDNNDKFLSDEFFENDDISKNQSIKESSTGEGVFSILSFCLYFLKTLESEEILNNEYKHLIIIDEPEKFCHVSLVNKIAKILYEFLTLNVSIIFTTHSPEIIFQIYRSNRTKNNKNIEMYKTLDNYEYKLVPVISQNNSGTNSREMKILINALFDENVFLAEGLKDYELVCEIMDNDFENYFYNVYDCSGKKTIEKIAKKMIELQINSKIFVLFDKDFDPNQPETSNNYVQEIKKLGLSFYEFDNEIEDFLNSGGGGNNKSKKNDLSNIHYSKIKNLKKYPDLKKEIEDFLNSQKNSVK